MTKTTTRRPRGSSPLSSNGSSCTTSTIPQQQQQQQHARTALVLGGWSPGPFYYLESFLKEQGFILLKPVIEMPPVTAGWCCTWQAVLLLLGYIAFTWFMRRWCRYITRRRHPLGLLGAWAVLLLVTCAWLRLLVAHAVHASIQYNVRLCQRIMVERRISLVIGFSWGGAVAAELLAQQDTMHSSASASLPDNHHSLIPVEETSSLPHDDETCFLLLAPTTAVVAALDLFQPLDAALRLRQGSRRNVVVVVHATHDPVFCPHAERWGTSLTRLRDNHVFLRSSSERALKEIITGLIQQRQPQA